MALITCDHCSFSYEGHTVLQDLSLQVERGEYLCIVGENGSGKSTLIKGLLGLIAPSKGKITYEAGFHNTEIGYLPQRTEAQKDFPASVWEVVSSGCRGLNLFPTKAQREMIDRNLALMGMEDRKKSSFAELSGGQQQRALLARVMISHDLDAALRQGDRILHLSHDGIFLGTPEEYRHSPLGQRFVGGCSHD